MLVIDVESSGVNPDKHSILSLGALDFTNPTNRFYDECKVWDGAHISDEALEVNGFTEEEARDASKKSEEALIRAFILWSKELDDWTFAGQNPSFDRDFVAAACLRAHIEFPFAHRTLDTHSIAYAHMVTRGRTPPFDTAHRRSALDLDAILQYVGIPSEPTPHNALTGAMSHAEVLSRLLNGKKLLPEFEMYEMPLQQGSV